MKTLLTPRSSPITRPPSSARFTPLSTAALPQIYIHPGQLYVTADAVAMSTVLGSCVSVCLYDACAKIGGMNHFLLPDHTSDADVFGRYGPSATQELLDRMFALGARAETMTARLVGGANVLSAIRVKPPLGARNVAAATEVLYAANIVVVGRDVGGETGRKLIFSPRDGTTFVKQLGR